MIANLMWVVTVASIIGTVLNIRKCGVCFWIWLVTNSAWTIYDCYIANWAQAGLSLVYVGLAIWGIYAWKHKK